ncbi:MAG: hypothetical protein JWO04_1243 [Gammaproteobacteria bacterium]|nr:hypothetical protein [Gammaproteobacteria bacterium]
MGIEYWDPEGVNILAYGGPYYFNGGYPPDSIYIWNGLTLFNNADTSGSSNQAEPSYSELLTGIDALGNKLDPTLKYKLVTPHGSNGQFRAMALVSSRCAAPLISGRPVCLHDRELSFRITPTL